MYMYDIKWVIRVGSHICSEVSLDTFDGIIKVTLLFLELDPNIPSVLIDEEGHELITMN